MLSLVLKVCLMDQPCKETRVASFHTASAWNMCETNRLNMQRDSDAQNHKGTFECRVGLTTFKMEPVATLNLNVCANGTECEDVKVAEFYGRQSGAPLCAKNADFYRGPLEESAKATHATIKLDCHS